MDLTLTEEQELLRSSANHYLCDQSTPTRVRELADSAEGWSASDWRHIASELGWIGAAVPEAYGGLGLGVAELVVLQQELGRALYPSPFFAVSGLAVPAMLELGTPKQLERLLPPIIGGESIATLVFTDMQGQPFPAGVQITAKAGADTVRLTGAAGFVLFGHAADLLLVVAHEGDGLSLFAVPSRTLGVTLRRLKSADPARQLSALSLDAEVPASARLGIAGQAQAALQRVMLRAAVIQAAEQIGGAERCIEMAVAYSQQRVQFGRPIGSFQALKHFMADSYVACETGKSMLWYAACVAEGQIDSLDEVAPMVKAYASDAFLRCVQDTIQLHGGMGYTWGCDAHLYLKHARATANFLGDSAWQREQLAAALKLVPETIPREFQ